MLPKHWARRVKTQESLQRTLCRAAVISCAVLPILCLMTATLYWKLPWVSRSYANQLSAMISDHCGVSATIGELKYLAPNRVEIRNLKVSHPETFEVMLEVPSLTAERHSSQWEVRMDSSHCALDQVLKLSRMAHDRFLCRADDRLAPVRVIANKTSVTEGNNTLWEGAADVLFSPSSQKSDLRINFWANGKENPPIGILFVRDRNQTVHFTSTQLETRGARVPISLMKDVMPLSRYLGNDATFEGAAVWLRGEHDSMAIGKSAIRNIQWQVATSPLSFQMSGRGNVFIDQAKIEDGRLEDVRGILDAFDGSIPKERLAKAISMLGLRMPDGMTLGQGPSHEYRYLELKFEITPAGIRIAGGSNIKPQYPHWPSAILSDANGPLIYEGLPDADNNPATLPISQLVSWFCSNANDELNNNPVKPAAYQVPNAAQSNPLGAYMMTVLPSPSARR